MDNVATGVRKRTQSNHTMDDWDQAIKQAECKLAARRQARAEAREIRMRELEKSQKVADENADKIYDAYNNSSSDVASNKISRGVSSCITNGKNTSSLVSSPVSNNSRRSSEDSLEESFNYRDLKLEIKEAECKFRKAMIQNAQLDNEKAAATYQVELYSDKLQDLEEKFSSLQVEFKEKAREYDQLKRLSAQTNDELNFYKSELEERDKLIQEHGLKLVYVDDSIDSEDSGIEMINGDHHKEQSALTENGDSKKSLRRVLVSTASANLLSDAFSGYSLDTKLKRFNQERRELMDEIAKLRIELEEEKKRRRGSSYTGSVLNGENIEDCDDLPKENNRLAGDYKFKWQKAEQDISTLQANVARLESQVIRYKSAAETSEKIEDELKVEKRKLQRELREAQCRIDELETTNTHLQRRLDKLKNAKSALLKEI